MATIKNNLCLPVLYFRTKFLLGVDENNSPLTVKDLLKGLYDKACQQKRWGLVRHSAGN